MTAEVWFAICAPLTAAVYGGILFWLSERHRQRLSREAAADRERLDREADGHRAQLRAQWESK